MKYYTGDTIPLGVIVKEGDQPLAVDSAILTLYQQDGTCLISGAPATIGGDNNNEVTYLVPARTTKQECKHYAYFAMKFLGGRERTFGIETMVYANPQKVRQ